MRIVAGLLLFLLLAACAPATRNALIDETVARIDRYARCVSSGQTFIARSDDANAPATLTPLAFASGEVRDTAEAISSAGVQPAQLVQTGGPVAHGRCTTRVDEPAFSGNFAFLTYQTGGGTLGTIVFRKAGSGWIGVENASLGFW